jgi:hypothetical protein
MIAYMSITHVYHTCVSHMFIPIINTCVCVCVCVCVRACVIACLCIHIDGERARARERERERERRRGPVRHCTVHIGRTYARAIFSLL